RAGRRGRDAVGYSLWPSADAFDILAKAKRNRCDSRLKNDPTTFLGLVSQGLSNKHIEQFYGRSFMRFNDSGVDLGLIRRSRILQKLNVDALPCESPAHEYARFLIEEKDSLCHTCPLKKPCHRYIDAKSGNDLAALHLHMHV